MIDDINLREIENKAWRLVFQDGIWDIYLGLMLMAAGIAGFGENYNIFLHVPLMFAALLLLFIGKKHITAPRVGYVKFGPARKRRIGWMHVAMVASVLFTVVLLQATLGMFTDFGTWLVSHWIIPVVGLKFLLIGAIAAYLLDFNRLYYIGAAYAAAICASMIWRAPLPYFIFGGLVMIPGIVLFVLFIRRYPSPFSGAEDGAR